MDIMKVVSWIASNYVELLQAIVVILGAMGVILETINKIISKDGVSALSKVAKVIARAGEIVQKVIDFVTQAKKPKA